MTEKKANTTSSNTNKKVPTPKFDPKNIKGSKPNKGFTGNTSFVRRSGRGG